MAEWAQTVFRTNTRNTKQKRVRLILTPPIFRLHHVGCTCLRNHRFHCLSRPKIPLFYGSRNSSLRFFFDGQEASSSYVVAKPPGLYACMYMVMLTPDKSLTMERFLATCNRLTGTYAPFSREVVDLYSPDYILCHI